MVNENKIVKEKAKATTEGSYKATRSKEGSTKSPLVTGSPPNSHSVKPNACKNIGCLSKLCANGQDEKKPSQEQNADCYCRLLMCAELIPKASTTSIHKTELLEHFSLSEHSLKSQGKKRKRKDGGTGEE